MACPEWSEKLSAYLDGMLDTEQARAVAGHLEACPDCRQTLRDWRRIRERLRALPIPPPDAGMWRRVMHRVARCTAARRFVIPRRLFWWAAGAACFVGALLAWWWQQAATTSPTTSPAPINLFVGYHADAVALTLGDCPTWHLVATNELMEGE